MDTGGLALSRTTARRARPDADLTAATVATPGPSSRATAPDAPTPRRRRWVDAVLAAHRAGVPF